MKSSEIRQKFLEFFESHGHTIVQQARNAVCVQAANIMIWKMSAIPRGIIRFLKCWEILALAITLSEMPFNLLGNSLPYHSKFHVKNYG